MFCSQLCKNFNCQQTWQNQVVEKCLGTEMLESESEICKFRIKIFTNELPVCRSLLFFLLFHAFHFVFLTEMKPFFANSPISHSPHFRIRCVNECYFQNFRIAIQFTSFKNLKIVYLCACFCSLSFSLFASVIFSFLLKRTAFSRNLSYNS